MSDIPSFYQPSPEYNKPVSLRVTQEQFDALEAAEEALEMTKTDILRSALHEWMHQEERAEKIESVLRKRRKT